MLNLGSINQLAQDLFLLDEDEYYELLSHLAKYSGLQKLEFMNQVADEAIKNYQDLKKWRDQVGETT